MAPGKIDPKNLSNQVKPVPHSTDSRNLLECRPPQRQEDSRTSPNIVEASNQPQRTDYLTYGPTGHINPFVDIEIISL
jgi:hypothetical protein